jgi:uncharacterized protein
MRTGHYGDEHVLVLEPGEHVLETVTSYLKRNAIHAARFTAIGGFREVELKYFNMETKQYEHRTLHEQLEVISLVGDVSLREGEPFIHAHVVVGDAEYRAHAGHLGEGVVEPTLELFLTPIPGPLTREKDERTGLDLLRPETRAH